MAYIRAALSHESPIIFIQIEIDGKISKETFLSVFPRAHGMCFYHKNNQFVNTLTNGRFNPPPDGWRNTIYYPLFDDDDWYEDDDDYATDDDYQDDDYDQEYLEQDRKNNVCGKPPEKEDINMLYNHLLRDDQNDDSYDSYDD